MSDLATRFWSKVDKRGPAECWVWTGSRVPKGYGYLERRRAHRLSWELHNGPIPTGLFVCHRCDNPPCVNPSHLWLGTAADNTADMMAKGRHNPPPGKSHCKHGHPYAGGNLASAKSGRKVCRACNVAKTAKYRAKRGLVEQQEAA